MRKAAFAGLASLAGLWLFAALLGGGQRLPSHAATASVPALGLTVTAELFALSDLTEFERRLTLSAADGGAAPLRVRMADLRGPADRIGLYRVGDGPEVAVLDPAAGGGGGGSDGGFFAVGPLRRLDAPSRPPAEWTCLGAFELALVPNGGDPARGRAQVFAFVPAAPDGRAVPVPQDGAGRAAPRGAGDAGRSCPAPGPVEGGGAGAPRG